MTDRPDTAATAQVLDYLHQQTRKLGDAYTANLLESLSTAHAAGALKSTAALKTLAALLAYEDPTAARKAETRACRSMVMAALVNEIDLLFGPTADVNAATVAARLRAEGLTNVPPDERIEDALARRRYRRSYSRRDEEPPEVK